ncbi:MAG: SigB/SigF/SigG family RNA polymerase sigma factor [Clostridium sp.]|nr:SigB/SigF/SigG family RNA polymerase sigma factor [Clostridium sp.]
MDDTMKLIELAHGGDKAARERLVMDNVGLVWSIVRRFTGRGCETEDLFQIGSIGLLKAIDKFDTSYEVRFSTYAVPMILGEIKRFLRDDGMIKVSRSVKELGMRAGAARERLSGSLGREPTLEELATELGASCEEVAASLEAGCQVESLYAPGSAGEDSNLTLLDRMAEDKNEQEQMLNRMLLGELLKSLDKNQRELIVRRYFYNQTQTQIAGILGISQVQVSRMERKILKEMREKLS